MIEVCVAVIAGLLFTAVLFLQGIESELRKFNSRNRAEDARRAFRESYPSDSKGSLGRL